MTRVLSREGTHDRAGHEPVVELVSDTVMLAVDLVDDPGAFGPAVSRSARGVYRHQLSFRTAFLRPHT